MFNKFFLLCLSSVFILLLPSFSPAQTDSLVLFSDDFESYTAGGQIACQDTIHWDTWNSVPCDPIEDPYVTNINSYSGTNSVWIQQDNDLVKPTPNYTYGKYSISFYMYIPADYTASWGQLAAFYNPDSTEWGFYVKFNPLGNGVLVAGGWGTAQFSFSYDTWMHNELIVDLNSDLAEYYFEGNLIHGWQWTLGNGGDTCKLQLSVTDLLGSNWPNPDSSQWYLDDYVLVRIDTIVGVKDFSEPTEFTLEQNYPNPFNPKTKIEFRIADFGFVSLKVYDVLGREVATVVNEEKAMGSYKIEFNGSELTSGVYFYQLQAGSFVETKKMVLLK